MYFLIYNFIGPLKLPAINGLYFLQICYDNKNIF
ncbi:Uncharacterised protein [Moraxella bovis]|uniref:Uncharacterized protein n=1 Tax=Moraxella bovis TaxID=476 RepID=A0A378PRP0_MORBO|nr:Uncharacterised protein [Moraxella bovis]